MCRWSTAKAITLGIGLMLDTSSREGITKRRFGGLLSRSQM
jgi:hypothetical protein